MDSWNWRLRSLILASGFIELPPSLISAFSFSSWRMLAALESALFALALFKGFTLFLPCFVFQALIIAFICELYHFTG
jgi:hypothetical protein